MDARQAELEACHKSLLHAMGRMQAWRDEQMRQGAPAVVEASPAATGGVWPSVSPDRADGRAGADVRVDQRVGEESVSEAEADWSSGATVSGEWICGSSCNGADVRF